MLVCGILSGRWVQAALGIESWKEVQAAMIASGDPDFWKLARLATIEQVLKYGFVFLLFYGIGRWHRDRRLPAYGFRLRPRSLGKLATIGVVGWAAAGVLPYALQVAAELLPVLGRGPDQWALFPDSWSVGFLVYTAAASFLLVPFVEELWARGFMVSRFSEDYGRAGGLLMSAVFFTLAHGQYFRLEVLSLGMLASLTLGSIVYGYIFLRTGSLVPVVVAHALINVPPPPAAWARPAILGIMLAVLLVARRSVLYWLQGALETLAGTRWAWTAAGFAGLVVCLAAVAIAGDSLPRVAAALKA